MKITAWYGRPNEMSGRAIESVEKALAFLRRKRDSVRYVEINGFEQI